MSKYTEILRAVQDDIYNEIPIVDYHELAQTMLVRVRENISDEDFIENNKGLAPIYCEVRSALQDLARASFKLDQTITEELRHEQ